jgi:hypothetical protein
MKNILWGVVALGILAAGPARAGDIVFKPIDTQKLVVQPSKVAANLAAKTINLVGQTAAGSIEQNGYVKTINNLFGKKIISPKTQAGPSPLPAPSTFSSNQYKSFNTPVMPVSQATRH